MLDHMRYSSWNIQNQLVSFYNFMGNNAIKNWIVTVKVHLGRVQHTNPVGASIKEMEHVERASFIEIY